MGGRGKIKKIKNKDRWSWLEDVSDQRLNKYIKRSMYLSGSGDPQGRSIHDVAYWAGKELQRRKP